MSINVYPAPVQNVTATNPSLEIEARLQNIKSDETLKELKKNNIYLAYITKLEITDNDIEG